jgi:outer membrane receptor protein involved in Fe transport
VTDKYEIRGGVTNLANQDPPSFRANTDPSPHDVLGRRVYLAVKAKF